MFKNSTLPKSFKHATFLIGFRNMKIIVVNLNISEKPNRGIINNGRLS